MGREHLPDLMGPFTIDVLEHVGELKEELVRILLAGGNHVVHFPAMRSEETVHLTRLHVVVHRGVDVCKSPVPTVRLSAFITSAV